MKEPKVKQFIVCAAIRRDGLIIPGVRHFDPLMRDILKALGTGYTNWEHGFVDNQGVFLTREEAWVIADLGGQIRRPTGWEDGSTSRKANVGDAGLLFSENLY